MYICLQTVVRGTHAELRETSPQRQCAFQGGEKVRAAEEVRRCEHEPPSEPIQFMTDYSVNRHEAVQVRRYEYEPACPPPHPGHPGIRLRPISTWSTPRVTVPTSVCSHPTSLRTVPPAVLRHAHRSGDRAPGAALGI